MSDMVCIIIQYDSLKLSQLIFTVDVLNISLTFVTHVLSLSVTIVTLTTESHCVGTHANLLLYILTSLYNAKSRTAPGMDGTCEWIL